MFDCMVVKHTSSALNILCYVGGLSRGIECWPICTHHKSFEIYILPGNLNQKLYKMYAHKVPLILIDAAAVKLQLRGRTLNFYPPSNYTEAAHSGEAPDKKLQLEWVYPLI